MKQAEKTEEPRPTGRLRGFLRAGAVLLAGVLTAGCVSVAPPEPVAVPEADRDQSFVQTFLSHYQALRDSEEPGLFCLTVFGGGEVLSLPGCSWPLWPDGFEGEAHLPGGSSLAVREVRGPLLYLSGGTLEDYEGRDTAGGIILVEPVEEELALAVHQARLFGAAAVAAAPRADGSSGKSSRDFTTPAPAGFRDPGIPVFLLFPSGAALLRSREGAEVALVFPEEAQRPADRRTRRFGDTGYLSVSPEERGEERPGGFLLMPERRVEEERRVRALQAALAQHNRILSRSWEGFPGRCPDSSPEEWVRDILQRDRQALPLLPWEPRLKEAWTRRAGENEDPEFYHAVLDRVENWNLQASGTARVTPEDPRRSVDGNPEPQRWEAEMTPIIRDLRKFWRVLELNLLNRALREGVNLLETGREEALSRLFTPFLVSAWAIPRFHPEAATAAEPGRSTASLERGGRWLPELGDLFLSLHLGLHHHRETRAGMIKELKYWESRSRIVLKKAEDEFRAVFCGLLESMDRLTEAVAGTPEPVVSALPIP